jgi:hypothetical protein
VSRFERWSWTLAHAAVIVIGCAALALCLAGYFDQVAPK